MGLDTTSSVTSCPPLDQTMRFLFEVYMSQLVPITPDRVILNAMKNGFEMYFEVLISF
ncbi:hypothetical protein EV197_3152 [Aquimarina brevivitae]|uniref:Uncharacterized protein n=1 Tax=Aquimarina brevivitae TaxID=323412 RepID=A0A4Q7NUA1_9FLAO|nr:hypothetical protein EV197_3152 [Aquimarina brevivitae]